MFLCARESLAHGDRVCGMAPDQASLPNAPAPCDLSIPLAARRDCSGPEWAGRPPYLAGQTKSARSAKMPDERPRERTLRQHREIEIEGFV